MDGSVLFGPQGNKLAWLFHEPHTGFDDCLRVLQSDLAKGSLISNSSLSRWHRKATEIVKNPMAKPIPSKLDERKGGGSTAR